MPERGGLIARFALLLALWLPGAAVAATCDVVPQGPDFGAYDPLSPSPADTVGSIGLRCDTPVSFTISLSAGSGSFAERRMTSGSSELGYNLYTDAARTLVWGDGSGGSATVSATAQNEDFPLYARAPPRQPATAGVYADAIVITIDY
jgi:spore coat protein U-like protein